MANPVGQQVIDAFMSFETFTTPREVLRYLHLITTNKYGVAASSQRKWGSEESEVESGTFYQIMPDDEDGGFFDWYCDTRPYNQFFTSIDAAVIHFVLYWHIWIKQTDNA